MYIFKKVNSYRLFELKDKYQADKIKLICLENGSKYDLIAKCKPDEDLKDVKSVCRDILGMDTKKNIVILQINPSLSSGVTMTKIYAKALPYNEAKEYKRLELEEDDYIPKDGDHST